MNAPTDDPPVQSRLRVLVLSPFFPFPPTSGFSVRTYHLTRALAERHDVTLLTYVTPEYEAHVTELAAQFRVEVVRQRHKLGVAKRLSQLHALASTRPFAAHMVRSEEMQQALDKLCAEQRFDLIQVESCTMAQFNFPAGVPVVMDEHNIEYELRQRLVRGERSIVRRAYNYLEQLRFRAFEQRCWRRSAGCLVTSEREIPLVSQAAPHTLAAVVPNGVDLEGFAPSDTPVEPDTVVFNGIFGYRPNADAAEYLVDEIWPRVLARRPTARLLLVGRMPAAAERRLAKPGVEILGEVEQLQPYLARAAVIAVPIRMGAGTRLKVLEGLSMGKAMVSTSAGCEGVAVNDGQELIIADDPESFANGILELFDQPDRRAELGRAGRQLIQERYSWKIAYDQLEALYGRVLQRSG